MAATLVRCVRPIQRACAAIALAATATASVIVVDDGGGVGVDYTDLPEAVAAAVAGDLIVVHPGTYSGFVLGSGVTILGLGPGVLVSTSARISLLPAGQTAVLADLRVRDLSVLDCAGTVVIDGVSSGPVTGGQPFLLKVASSFDVRVRSVTLQPTSTTGQSALVASASRVEIVQSSLQGAWGFNNSCGTAGNGTTGVSVSAASRMHVVATDVRGGSGGAAPGPCPSFCNPQGGNGGTGLSLVGTSTLFLMGSADVVVGGGNAGLGGGSGCRCDGNAGNGLSVSGSSARYSGVLLAPGGGFCCCTGSAITVGGGGSAVESVPADPYLELDGVPAPGAELRFTVFGEPGDHVSLLLGRYPFLLSLPDVAIEMLTSEERELALGTIGVEGNVTLLFVCPSGLPQGFTFHAQARVLRGTTEHRTNSTPLVVR